MYLNFTALEHHEIYMQRCLDLAKLGARNVAPNPMVGAVLVYDDTLIGEGYHMEFGKAHAEVNCINSVANIHQHLIEKSTLYVSLEPCHHVGKTPPCTSLIIEKKIPKVVIGCLDPFEKVNGSGKLFLEENGVTVIASVLEKAAKDLNKRFICFHQNKRPYVVLKWAQTNNGKIGVTNQRIPISNNISNVLVHQWRTEEMGIMVGTQTVLIDNPHLTARLYPGKNPIRICIDNNLRIPADANIFDTSSETIIYNEKIEEVREHVSFVQLKKEDGISKILEDLHHRNIQSILVEGGAKLLQSFIDAGTWDEARVITNKELFISEGVDAPILKDALFCKKTFQQQDEIGYYKHKKI
jgi:diaminohydroxyphosphoribosylaminopyrimidine deaminase/5-amino-6-(5-phosphoribosylamino)uracil reductase